MKSLANWTLTCLIILGTGNLWAQSFNSFTTSNGLPDNNVNGVAVDQANVKWFGTQAGVARFDGSVWQIFTTADGLIDNYINCIAVDKNNHIWIGTDIGISTYNGTQWTSYTSTDGLVNDMISCIGADLSGNVWIGTFNGLSKFDGSVFTNYTTANGLTSDMISYITADAGDNIWIGSWIGGLMMFNGTTFTSFTTANGLPDNNISSIAIDEAGNKFIGTYMGIAKLDNNNNYVTTYTATGGLLNDYVKDLAVNSVQDLYAGIYADYLQEGGLSWYNQTEWTNYVVSDGLVNNMVKRIAIDADDHVWIATGNGVSEFIPLTGVREPLAQISGIYPNPASEYIRLDNIEADASVMVLRCDGTAVIRTTPGPEGKINIGGLGTGLYFVKVNSHTKSYYGKFLVK